MENDSGSQDREVSHRSSISFAPAIDPRQGLSFGLIHRHPGPYGWVRREILALVTDRRRSPNGGRQTWKAGLRETPHEFESRIPRQADQGRCWAAVLKSGNDVTPCGPDRPASRHREKRAIRHV
jgi:hypothetical protein